VQFIQVQVPHAPFIPIGIYLLLSNKSLWLALNNNARPPVVLASYDRVSSAR